MARKRTPRKTGLHAAPAAEVERPRVVTKPAKGKKKPPSSGDGEAG